MLCFVRDHVKKYPEVSQSVDKDAIYFLCVIHCIFHLYFIFFKSFEVLLAAARGNNMWADGRLIVRELAGGEIAV